jgi:hypothetical protein
MEYLLTQSHSSIESSLLVATTGGEATTSSFGFFETPFAFDLGALE